MVVEGPNAICIRVRNYFRATDADGHCDRNHCSRIEIDSFVSTDGNVGVQLEVYLLEPKRIIVAFRVRRLFSIRWILFMRRRRNVKLGRRGLRFGLELLSPLAGRFFV